ncbi:hypothetical protein OXB_2889 [Bacillus sp. OxB-1]|uniref:hypothetical protein n=1 Tax=Bacillus sp. (strain OxB-1) TaxID=98228 RepID=UPI000582014D|nr:hypothetical protein [Bacillus sp. OxB-1]BAQ11360.1 hypothetical protein OXB_2889 [Bacillus sp. OxB-1]
MLKNKEFFNILPQKGLQFRREDSSELQFKINLDVDKIITYLDDFYHFYKSSFVISFSDFSLSMPTERDDIISALGLEASKNIDFILKLKKADLLISYPNTNSIIYYNISNFRDHIEKLNFDDFTEFVFNKKPLSQILIINTDIPLISNEFVHFFTLDDLEEIDEKVITRAIKKKDDILTQIDKLPNGNNTLSTVIPDQLFLKSDYSHSIKEIFNKWCAFQCISYLSSFIEKSDPNDNQNDYFNCYFNGQKRMILKTSFDLSKTHEIDGLLNFYKWVYSEKTEDKLKIFHNIVPSSLQLNHPISLDEFLIYLDSLIETAKENFNFYIQDNIKEYIEERKKIDDIVKSTGELISVEINRITDLLVKTLSSLFVSIVTAIIAMLLRAEIKTIISYGLYFYSVIILLSLIYTSYYSNASVQISFNNFINRMNEYTFLFDKSKMKNIKSSVTKRKNLFYKMFTANIIIFIGIIFLIFSLGMYFQNNENQVIEFLMKVINKVTVSQ